MSISINLELTDHCNIRCKMCSQSMRSDAHGMPKKFMAWDTWRKSLHNLKGYSDDIHLCPHWLGEPTMHPHFDQFIEYAFAINQHNTIFTRFKLHTNAVQLSHERSRLLLTLGRLPFLQPNTFNFVHFSIDAFSPSVYKTVKGRHRRDRVYQSVLDFLKLRAQLRCSYPKVTIAFVVQPENAHEAIPFQQYWQQVFQELNCSLDQFYDWPSEESDNLYFRRLNCSDQEASDQLHAETAYKLGLIDKPQASLRREGSF